MQGFVVSSAERLKPCPTLKASTRSIPVPGRSFLSFLQDQCFRGTYIHADGILHVPAPIAFDGRMHGSRWGNDPKGAYHHTHPTRNAGWLIDIDQPCCRVSAHRPIGTGVNTWGHFTMATMEGEVVPLDINSGDRLRFLVNGGIKFFPLSANLNAAPKIPGMAVSTF